MDELLRDFLIETGETIDRVGHEIVRLEHDPTDALVLGAIFRLVHTIKGTCGFIGLRRLERLTHAAENLLASIGQGQKATQSAVTLILATIDRLKQILHGLEETGQEPPGDDADLIALLTARSEVKREGVGHHDAPATRFAQRVTLGRRPADGRPRLLRIEPEILDVIAQGVSDLACVRARLEAAGLNGPDGEPLSALRQLASVAGILESALARAAHQPASAAFRRLPALVESLGRMVGKEIALQCEGGHTQIPRELVEPLADALVHLVRNAADHGIEGPAARRSAGKDMRGTITVTAMRDAQSLTVCVRDDGRGLDIPAIRERALERGLIVEADQAWLATDSLAQFIFHPGFSTAPMLTAISGRGVGLDVVRAMVEDFGGTLSAGWTQGKGTDFSITIPCRQTRVRRVMLVEGSPFYRGLLARPMEQAGFSLTLSADLDQALAIAADTAPFDAVVCDLDAIHATDEPRIGALAATGCVVVGTCIHPGAIMVALARALGLVALVSKFHPDEVIAVLAQPESDATPLSAGLDETHDGKDIQ